jgi:GT2 family glycosyltransferase
MEPKVSIILLNWNGWEDSIECLESIYQIKYPNYNVILVDNNSEDESIDKIHDYCNGKITVESEFFEYKPNNKPIEIIKAETDKKGQPSTNSLILIENTKNYGFAEGNNIGIKYALKSLKTEYVLLLNNDTVVDENFLDELIKMGESDEKIGLIGPKTLFYDKKDTLQEAGGGNVDLIHCQVHEIGFNAVDDGSYNKYLEPDYIGGACLLIKKSVINEVGLLDSNYFMYWEDVDWCFTSHEYGYKCSYAYKSMIWHKYGTSSENYFKMYYLNRNRLYFMRKHASRSQYLQFLAYYIPYIIFESFYQLIRRRDVDMYHSYSRGLMDGFKMIPPVSDHK